MKITLEFSDDDPDDYDRAMRALTADGCYAVLWDLIHHYLRNMIKHGTLDGKTLTEQEIQLCEKIRDYMTDYMDSEGVHLDAYYQ